jgi:hypothetical protein
LAFDSGFLLHLLTAAFGPKRTSRNSGLESAFGGKADIRWHQLIQCMRTRCRRRSALERRRAVVCGCEKRGRTCVARVSDPAVDQETHGPGRGPSHEFGLGHWRDRDSERHYQGRPNPATRSMPRGSVALCLKEPRPEVHSAEAQAKTRQGGLILSPAAQLNYYRRRHPWHRYSEVAACRCRYRVR